MAPCQNCLKTIAMPNKPHKPMPENMMLAFVASSSQEAQEAMGALTERYGGVAPQEADVIIALGGDGLMLQTLHETLQTEKPIYGMNRGSIGFLMNEFSQERLRERILAAKPAILHPLRMCVRDDAGRRLEAIAINEVSTFRQTYQAAKLEIGIDDQIRMAELIADGLLVATPAGSTAYNFSASGPILPLNAPLLALTPLSPYRPRRWRGALLPDRARVHVRVLEADKRPVSAVADHTEFRNVTSIEIAMDFDKNLILLHDSGHSLDERILREQFGV